jgi:hypothetical protein
MSSMRIYNIEKKILKNYFIIEKKIYLLDSSFILSANLFSVS